MFNWFTVNMFNIDLDQADNLAAEELPPGISGATAMSDHKELTKLPKQGLNHGRFEFRI